MISENYASDVTRDGNDREEDEETAGSLDARKMRVVWIDFSPGRVKP